MTRGSTLAHISDLHLSPEFRRLNIRRVKRLLEIVARRDIDHLVITGDIAANAQPKDFEIARSLLQSYGFLDPQRTTIIPGNHDIYGGVHTAEDVLEFPSRCRRTDLVRARELFTEYFRELFTNCAFEGTGIAFPFVKNLRHVTLLGLDSVAPYSVVKNPVGSNGSIAKAQLEAAFRLLSTHAVPGNPRIALIHHHFHKPARVDGDGLGSLWGNLEQQTMKLWKKKRLLRFFAGEKIDLVLHGHVHVNAAYERKGVRFVNAGGSVMQSTEDGVSLNLITIEGSTVTTAFHRESATPQLTPATYATAGISLSRTSPTLLPPVRRMPPPVTVPVPQRTLSEGTRGQQQGRRGGT